MKKELTSAEAAALIYGKPGAKVIDHVGQQVWVSSNGVLMQNEGGHSGALGAYWGPFTLPADPDELPEDLQELLIGYGGTRKIVEALWRHIKPEAKR